MVRTRALMQVYSRIDVPGRHEVLREVRPARRPLGRLVHQNGALQVPVCDRHQERILRARVDAQTELIENALEESVLTYWPVSLLSTIPLP